MDRSYFDDIYRYAPDPWGFESRWYEERKYALTMASLPDRRYRSAFEPGCSVGMLSRLLGERCDRLLSTDIVTSMVDRCRDRCRDLPGVRVEEGSIPDDWPAGPFDLVVLSEIAYYFDQPALEGLLSDVIRTTHPGATIVGVHWRGTTNYPLTGDQAHEVIDARPELERLVRHEETEFLLEVWTRTG